MKLTEWELLFMYKKAIGTMPYLKVLLERDEVATDCYVTKEVNRLKRLKAKLSKELQEKHGYGKEYLKSLS